MKPVSIGGTFGWFSAGRNQRGIVLCGTLGFEQHSAHRWWRDLSEGIAATGCTVLRFDYPGEGDSEGHSVQLDPALDAIRQAIRFLRDQTRVEEIILVGLRLGATLAALIAEEGGIDRLVLLAPFPSGRAYLREMELQARLLDITPDGATLWKRPDTLSVGGFAFAPDLIQDLKHVDLSRAGSPIAKRILLLGPDPASLATRYANLGSRVEVGELPGLAPLLSDAHQVRMPEDTRTQILKFVSEETAPRPTLSLRAQISGDAITGAGWREEPVQFKDGLFGIRCRPQAALSKAPAVLFVNMAVHTHSGYGRQTTTLARTLAQHGISSLRMDLRGVGDSADRLDGELPLYRLDAVEDIRAGIDVLIQGEARPVIAIGTCSGAYLAFHALCQDRRIAAAVLANLYCFDWDLTHGGETYAAKPVRHVSAYAAMGFSWPTWRRVLTGVTPVGVILHTLARRGFSRLFDRLIKRHQLGGASHPIIPRRAAFRRRGARLVLLYSAGDLGLVDLRTQLGSVDGAAAHLGEPVHVIADADHSFAADPAQAMLLREVQRLAAVLGSGHHARTTTGLSFADRMTIVPQQSPEAA